MGYHLIIIGMYPLYKVNEPFLYTTFHQTTVSWVWYCNLLFQHFTGLGCCTEGELLKRKYFIIAYKTKGYKKPKEAPYKVKVQKVFLSSI